MLALLPVSVVPLRLPQALPADQRAAVTLHLLLVHLQLASVGQHLSAQETRHHLLVVVSKSQQVAALHRLVAELLYNLLVMKLALHLLVILLLELELQMLQHQVQFKCQQVQVQVSAVLVIL